VVQVDGNKIFIHYTGWSRKWDEWVFSCNTPQYTSKDGNTVRATVTNRFLLFRRFCFLPLIRLTRCVVVVVLRWP
jgi:hypothetical protein